MPEHIRVAFTRLRLSAHRLRIETGRWARLPPNERLCSCGHIQDEPHVNQLCPLVQHIREACGKHNMTFPASISQAKELNDFKVLYDILMFFE